MNELLKQSASDFDENIKVFSAPVPNDTNGIYTFVVDKQEVLDWHTKQMQLVYEKGREDGINQIKEEHRNEAINWYD